jgi:hypothetical protein
VPIALLISAVLLAGCGGGGETESARPIDERYATTADAPTASTATSVPDGPYIGTWTATLTQDALVGATADHRYAGQFRLSLRRDGTYTTFQALDGESSGHYRAVRDDYLVFTDDVGCDEFSVGGSTGVYRWSVSDDELTLTIVRAESGGCTGRSDTLSIPRWNRS